MGKTWWVAVGLSLGIACAQTASARVAVGVSIGIAPPPVLVEHVAVSPGYAWAPGYWRWNGARHVWVGGVWIHGRPGRAYVPARWARVAPAWRFHGGYWR
jgi:hypothetical protein